MTGLLWTLVTVLLCLVAFSIGVVYGIEEQKKVDGFDSESVVRALHEKVSSDEREGGASES